MKTQGRSRRPSEALQNGFADRAAALHRRCTSRRLAALMAPAILVTVVLITPDATACKTACLPLEHKKHGQEGAFLPGPLA